MRVFKLSERDLQPGCREIRIEGEVDLAVADRLQEALDRAAAESEQVLIGLEECAFIDSTGIAVILRAHRQGGCRVVVFAPRNQVLRALSITGLTENGLVFDSVDAALAAA